MAEKKSSKESWLLPDFMLDSHIIRCLYNFHDFDTLTFERFARTIRHASLEDRREFLKPFLKDLPSFPRANGKTAKKLKHRAAGLLLQSGDVGSLFKAFGNEYESVTAFKNFLKRGAPDEVARFFKDTTTAPSDAELPDSVRQLTRNRVAVLGSQQETNAVVETVPSTSKVSTEDTVDLAPTQSILNQLDPSHHEGINHIYVEALKSGLTTKQATKKARRAARKLEVSTDEKLEGREAYPSPSSPELTAVATLAPEDGLPPSNDSSASKKRKLQMEYPADVGSKPVVVGGESL